MNIKRKKIFNLVLIALTVVTIFSCGKDSEEVEYLETVIPSSIEALYESRGDVDSDTAWVFLQGGPTTQRGYSLEIEDDGDFPFFHDDLRVYPFQAQHLNNTITRSSNFTFEDAKVEDSRSIEMITRVVENLKNQGKVVYVIGHSFGAFLAQEFVAVNGGNFAEKVLILNGRLDMDETVWQGFGRGETWEFDEQGLNPTLITDNADNQEEKNMSIMAAGLGNNRYTQKLADVDLSKVIFVGAQFDSSVGRYTDEELKFADDNALLGVILPEFGHSDIFIPELMEVLQRRMIE